MDVPQNFLEEQPLAAIELNYQATVNIHLARRQGLIRELQWLKVQEYHRPRQNFHYQALHQPGIVCGLGVKIITPDSQVPEAYKDGRGIQIQPGIAIDLQGNPIIVPQAQNLQINKRPQKET